MGAATAASNSMACRTMRRASSGWAAANRGYSACDTALPTSVAGAFKYRSASPQKPAAASPCQATSRATASASCAVPKKACGVFSKGKSRYVCMACRMRCFSSAAHAAGAGGNTARQPCSGAGQSSNKAASTQATMGAITSAQASCMLAACCCRCHNQNPNSTCNTAPPPYCTTRLMASAR